MEKNTIELGNCFEVMRKLEDKIFDVSFTSPPYNRIRKDTYKYYNDTLQDYYEMIVNLGNELLRLTKKDVIINLQQNIFNKTEVFKFIGYFAEKIKGVIIWGKNNPQPNINYRETDNTFSITNAYEYFFILNENPVEFRSNRKTTNLLMTNVNSEHFEGHGAVMRLDVARKFILDFTREGDLVFDPFMGCGTTALACVMEKRNYFGSEIVKEYKNIAEERIKNELCQPSLFD